MSVIKILAPTLTSTALLVTTFLAVGGMHQAVPSEPSVHFTASGDFSTTPNSLSVMSSIGAIDPDLHIALGDLSYGTTGNEQAWCDVVTARVGAGFAFELIAGNHESNGQNGNINDFSACLPNQLPGLVGTYGRQYFVDVPADAPLIRYIMISPALQYPDSTWNYAAGSPRYNWTVGAIDAARSANIPWVVVSMHKPCFSMGAYNCDPGDSLINMLVDKRVDLVLNGHEHLYQRTHQLATSPTCPGLVPGTMSTHCIADNDDTMVKGAGTVFATVGSGGAPMRDINVSDSEAGYFARYSAANANPTWGSLDVRATATELTASFARASGGNFSDSFVIGPPDHTTNNPPSAFFSQTCNDLACAFNGGMSSDTDGTVAAYAWDFGDGATATGITPSHDYAAAGTYTVSLTVTDDDGANAVVTHPITVTAGACGDLALDNFQRAVTSGWGTADLGGIWTITGHAANLSVAGGVGQVSLPAGSTRKASLASASGTDIDTSAVFSLDRVPSGGGVYVTLVGRQMGASAYSASAWVRSNGSVFLVLRRGSTVLSAVPIGGLSYAAEQQLQLRVQVSGSSPTAVRAKIWRVGQAEPPAWTSSVTESTAGHQVAGSVGAEFSHSSSGTGTVLIRVDDFRSMNLP